MSYVFRDVLVVFTLVTVALYFNSWYFWSLYWVAQGTMFWALFVLGHDCSHGSFSDNPTLNTVVGHILHSSILVPYHGWRISHRTHHKNHGNIEKDESWVPVNYLWTYSKLPEKIYKSLEIKTRILRFTLPFPLFAYPLYLWYGSPGKEGSHFNPYSDLFSPNERKLVMTSTACWVVITFLLSYLCFLLDPVQMLKLYGVPHLIFIAWLDGVTYLHHHGYERKLPWYRGKNGATCEEGLQQ
ncbi:hypothetical protein SLEP1_g6994 [Rubroshorea leprosula]|uniref:Fatty acid desaturase domain-containing protein n=1 Tax=Rubroshorea leprosula TaxID=152421 RepID=A0AAV5I7X2_9ROSI|nr:hypothetical protein SLEP1_g6994 [Rubroshorea leprosula]